MQEKDYQKLLEEMVHAMVALRFTDFSRMIADTVKGEGFVLGYLNHNASAQPGDISQMMNASTAYVSKVLRGLEDKGMLLRQKDPDDRRKTLLVLTLKGRQEAGKMEQEVQTAIIAFLKSLGDEDASNFVRILSKIARKSEHPEENDTPS